MASSVPSFIGIHKEVESSAGNTIRVFCMRLTSASLPVPFEIAWSFDALCTLFTKDHERNAVYMVYD
jgi:hypothetical protein